MRGVSHFICAVLGILLFTGCVEELTPNLEQWTKIVGADLSSWGEEILVEENGEILIFGSIGKDVGGEEGVGAAVTRLNANGSFIDRRIYPLIEEYDASGWNFLPVDVANSARIRDARKLVNGGFIVLGVFDEVLVDDGQGGEGLVNLPFYLILNDQLELTEYVDLNPELATDFIPVRIQSRFYDNPDGTYGIHSRLYYGGLQPIGYSLISINADGSLSSGDVPSSDERFIDGGIRSVDYVFHVEGQRRVLGQRGAQFTVDDENGNMLNSLGFSGLFPFNDNELFLEALEDGSYLIIYSQPMPGDDEIRTLRLNDDFSIREEPRTIVTQDDEFVKGFVRLSNGNYAVYNLNIKSIEPSASLYLFDADFARINTWRFPGPPGDIKEDAEGNLLVLYNPVYNSQVVKSTVTKIPAHELL